MSGVHVEVHDGAADAAARDAVRAAMVRACGQLGVAPDSELTVVLAGDALLQSLNAGYRGQDKPTDVLSFAAAADATEPGAPPYLGDIIIAVPQAAANASVAGHGLHEELMLLAVHGLLHLLGYDDESDADAAVMMRQEIALGVRRPDDVPLFEPPETGGP